MKTSISRRLAFSVLVGLCIATPAGHAQYSFTIVADSAGPTFSSLGFSPSINNSGTAAFLANRDAGDFGIFTGNGGPATAIATTGATFSGFSAATSINSAGTVAFVGSNPTSGLYTGNGGATTPIALSSGPTFNGPTTPSINTAGTVAFYATLDAGGSGIFTGIGGAPTDIALTSGPFSSFVQSPSINAAGTVAFTANLDAGGAGIFTGTGGGTAAVISLSTASLFNSYSPASINASGTVAFAAALDVGGITGIFTSSGSGATYIALSSGPVFSSFGLGIAPSINAVGTVAFLGNLDAGGLGIYVGDGALTTRVIGTGDAFDGSTVSSLNFGPQGLNDLGQVGFRYQLADGRTGIAVASAIPEPGSALFGVAIIAAGLHHRRRTRPCAAPRLSGTPPRRLA